MKRFNNLFEKIVDVDNLKRAFFEASKNKKHLKTINKIKLKVDYYMNEIRNSLMSKSFKPSKQVHQIIKERLSNKERVITKTRFYPDQIIHHAVIQAIYPAITRGMYYYCSANVPGKGTVFAKRSCEKFLRTDYKNTKYCLKMDVKKFYQSVNLEKLKLKLRRVIKDKDALWLLDLIIDSGDDGLPLGTYTSQWLANFYLQDLDHFIKEKCKAKYLVRYADDIVIFHPNKRELLRMKYEIDKFLALIDLQIKKGWRIFKIADSEALDFVGYKMYRHKTAIRKRIFRNIRRLMIRIKNLIDSHKKVPLNKVRSFFSYYGYIVNSDSYFIEHHYIKPLNLYRLKLMLKN